jgi:hypothetical protein
MLMDSYSLTFIKTPVYVRLAVLFSFTLYSKQRLRLTKCLSPSIEHSDLTEIGLQEETGQGHHLQLIAGIQGQETGHPDADPELHHGEIEVPQETIGDQEREPHHVSEAPLEDSHPEGMMTEGLDLHPEETIGLLIQCRLRALLTP